jgi:hypothetical protein
MRGHGGLETAAERGTVNRSNDGLRAFFDRGEIIHQADPLTFTGRDLAEFFDVESGDEGSARADQHRGAHCIVLLNRLHRGKNAFGHAG